MGELLPTLVKQYGPLVAALAFFVWRDWRREDRLQTRVETLERDFRDVVIPLTENVAITLARNTEVLEENIKVMREVEKVFQ